MLANGISGKIASLGMFPKLQNKCYVEDNHSARKRMPI